MGKQSGMRFDLDAGDSLTDFRNRLDNLGKTQKTIENAIARDLSTSAADRIRPHVERAIRTSPAPQAPAVAQTVRAKRDRMIVITAGATNPKLSGWKRARQGRIWRGSIAYGVALGGPGRTQQNIAAGRVKAHRRTGVRRRVTAHQRTAHRRTQGNIYRITRRGIPNDPFSGWLAGHKERILDATKQEYADIILELARRNGWDIT